MLLQRNTQIALHAAILLAQDPHLTRRIQDLAATMGVPPSTLAGILHKLKETGLVRTEHGTLGGFVLARPPQLILLWDIFAATAELEGLELCVMGFAKCNENNPCPMHDTWAPFREQLMASLRSKNLLEATRESRGRV